MLKIKKNLSAIQQKFQSLKQAQKMYDEPTPIGQVAEIMTYGVVRQKQVDEYLQYVHNSPEISKALQINQNWLELNITEMILFLDRIIKYRNINKPKDQGTKQRLNIVPYSKKKKLKASNREAHQNPYVPQHLQGIKPSETQKEESPYISQEEDQVQIHDANQGALVEQEKTQGGQSKSAIDLFFNLPQDFKNYPVEERFVILLTNFGKNKTQLQKKFNVIYTHFKKEMYIPHETFKTNSEVLMDLRIFLKYYKDFQLSKRFRTNEATNLFKKLAMNGLWLDFQHFSQLHYTLIDMLSINDKELTSRLEQGEINDKKKANELKKQLSRTVKSIMQNFFKLKELTDLISQEKIKKLLNDQTGKKIIKKIVEVHSGLVEEDILFRLKQRIQEKKKKNSLLSINTQKIKDYSNSKLFQSQTLARSNTHQLSVYQMLKIPSFNTRQMKKLSIYSSLELLNMHKQKERLKQLINEEQNQKYLDAYFKKEKKLSSLFKSNSIGLKQIESKTAQDPMSPAFKSGQSVKSERKDELLIKNSFSLPRMKFS